MVQMSHAYHHVLGTVLRVLLVFDAVTLLFAGIVHLVGAQIPLGVGSFVEPPILPAGIVESLAGLLFVWATYATFMGRRAAWPAALVAHLFAIAGFVLGIVVTLSGTTPLNTVYHRVMLVVFVVGLILLLTRPGREAVGQALGQ